jgi:hypothetical protein
MVIEGEDGKAAQLNSPIDRGVPGAERAVATHLGIRARSLPLRSKSDARSYPHG